MLCLTRAAGRHRQHDRQRRAADHRPGARRVAPATCSGSSTATRWSSPRCCCSAGTSATGSAGAGCCWPGWSLFALTSRRRVVRRQHHRQLIAGRAAMGVGAALIFPATLALLVSTLPRSPGAGHRHRHLVRRHRPVGRARARSAAGCCSSTSPGLRCSWSTCRWPSIALVAGRLLLAESARPAAGPVRPARRARLDGRRRAAGLDDHRGAGARLDVGRPPSPGSRRRRWPLAGFVGWELRRPDPLLDVRLFANPRFSAASGAIALAFFGLFGFIFLITQYFQFVRGYGTLEAGLATLPFARGDRRAVARWRSWRCKRFGTKLVVAAGLAADGAGFVRGRRLGRRLRLLGPHRRLDGADGRRAGADHRPGHRGDHGRAAAGQAGAGSAVNDTTREVGGTLGVAVVGSVMSSIYGPLGRRRARRRRRPGAGRGARRGLGRRRTRGRRVSCPTGAAAAVQQAFLDGVSAGSWVAAAAPRRRGARRAGLPARPAPARRAPARAGHRLRGATWSTDIVAQVRSTHRFR